MTESEMQDMRLLDELAEKAGGYVAPHADEKTHYDYRGIAKYCKDRGIEPIDLTIRELNKFVIQ